MAEDRLRVNPAGNPEGINDIDASELKVLVTGAAEPTRLGDALQTAGSNVNQIIAGDNITVDPVGGTGAVTVEAAGASSSIVTDLANDPDTTTGLTYGYKAGVVPLPNGDTQELIAATIGPLTDDETNVVFYFDGAVQALVDGSSIPFEAIRLASVVTVSGAIDTITDVRTFLSPRTKSSVSVVTTAQFDKTNSDTLGNIPGLSVDVAAGGTYTFEATLFTTSDVGTGVKAAIAGTCTATSIIYEGTLYAAGISVASAATRSTALGTSVAGLTATTVARIDITGTIEVNAAGTLTVQFAENTAIALTTSSVLIGSKFSVTRVS